MPPKRKPFPENPFPAANNHNEQMRWKTNPLFCSDAETTHRVFSRRPAGRGEGKRFPLLARLAPLA